MSILWFVALFWLVVLEYFYPGTLESLYPNATDAQLVAYDCEVPVDDEGGRVPRLRIPPQYPKGALAAGIEGRVLLEGTISREGRILDPWVVAAEPPDIFEDVALSAFREWEYCPLPDHEDLSTKPMRIAIPFRISKD